MKATNFQLFIFCVVSLVLEAADVVEQVNREAMKKIAGGCDQFLLTEEKMVDILHDFYISKDGDLPNFFAKLDDYLEKERKNDEIFAKMIDYFYVCMNKADKTTLDQLKALARCPTFRKLSRTETPPYKKLVQVAGEHLLDGQLSKSITDTIKTNSMDETLSTCFSVLVEK